MMKLYHTRNGIVLEAKGKFFLLEKNNDPAGTSWDRFINDDALFEKLNSLSKTSQETDYFINTELLPPIGSRQELWACGVTYLRSKAGRQEESKASGGADFYAKVYEAERPEVFFKSTPHRIVGHNAFVRIRKDSSWNVPEPELTLAVTSSGKMIGYTIGNDMSSRSIEGENPLYLPQAKTYDGCASLGPCLLVTENPLHSNTAITMKIIRKNRQVFEGTVTINQMKRSLQELVAYVYRECSFPYGCLLMTGTGIVPESDFTLQSGDEIKITIDGIGALVNTVQ